MAFEGLSGKLSAVFKNLKNRGKLSEKDVAAAMREVRMALLEADVSYKVAKEFTANVSARAVGEEVLNSLTPAQQVIKIVNEELTKLMGESAARLNITNKIPCVIMLCGLQGSGKTTHAGKLALHLIKEGHRPLLVACDVYRPAAIKQLQVVGEQAGAHVFEMGTANPVDIAKAALRHAKDYGFDVVLLDTAGRLHIDETLMEELVNIKGAVQPDEILLVVDAMTGQDAVNVADAFHKQLSITGVILTKLDGDTRGGAALSVRQITGVPIKFAGVGEKLENLEVFHPDRMASRILGMGDVLSLIEKASAQVDEQQAEKMAEKLKKGKFDLQDMLEQLEQLQKMGPLESVLSMLPGGNKIKTTDASERQLVVTRAVIQSMTMAERHNPKLVTPPRKRRIAAGSGTAVEDVNRVLRQFEQTGKMMKMFTGKRGRRFRGMMGGGPGMPGMPM